MTFLLIISAGLTLFAVGAWVGWHWGYDDGMAAGYAAVDRYLRKKERHQ